MSKAGWHFIKDVRKRVKLPVQIATDQLAAYEWIHSTAFRVCGI